MRSASSNAPVQGAEVQIEGTDLRVQTHADGHNALQLPAGPHVLLIAFPYYTRVTLTWL